MKYPEFTSDIFFGLDKIEFKLYVDKILIEPLKEKVYTNLDCTIKNSI